MGRRTETEWAICLCCVSFMLHYTTWFKHHVVGRNIKEFFLKKKPRLLDDFIYYFTQFFFNIGLNLFKIRIYFTGFDFLMFTQVCKEKVSAYQKCTGLCFVGKITVLWSLIKLFVDCCVASFRRFLPIYFPCQLLASIFCALALVLIHLAVVPPMML